MSNQIAAFVLAVDIGTSSVRTALFDARARRVPGSLAQQEYQVSHAPVGAAELECGTLEEGFRKCLRFTLGKARRKNISDVGISCFWHSLVGVDAKGAALTSIYTWADARCREDAVALRKELSEKRYHALTGCMLRASYWPAKLRWLARTQSKLWKKVVRWQSPAEWLLGVYCDKGGNICAHGMATGTGLYNPVNKAWDEKIVKRCGLDLACLPSISEEPLTLRTSLHAHFPELAEARWWPAIGDGAAGNLGSGATEPGQAAINVGTSAAFRLMRSGEIDKVPFGLFCYRVDTRRYVVGGAVSNAGNLRAWCRRELNLSKDAVALDRALSARPNPMDSLVVLPFWSAERAPTWCEDANGLISGFSQNTSALDILQATTEAVYQRLALIADLSVPRGSRESKPLQIIVSGGILKSAGLLQRLADVLGRPVHPSMEPEASLRGAAVYALERNGCGVDSQRMVGQTVSPSRSIAALYAGERKRQQRLESLMTAAKKN